MVRWAAGRSRAKTLANCANPPLLIHMLGWSMNLFRIRGIQLTVHYTFFLLLAYYAQEGWMEAGLTGLMWNVWTLLAFFSCVVMHELGHSLTAMRFGIGVRRILLMPIGGMAEFDGIPRQPSRELLMTLAGPAVNFVIAAALWFIVDFPSDELANPYSFGGLIRNLFIANLVMGCFNLLPAFPMDGGRILRALLATQVSYLRATFWAATVGKIITALGVVVALYLHVWMLAVLFVFIFFVGEVEYRSVKRRELEEARWQERARDYASPPVNEPPLLPPLL
jgi:Zn-dependent protease